MPQAQTLSSVQAVLRREGKLVLAMVGLPARGKTFMARRLKRHLSWMGYRIEIYNVGNYRRKYLGANQPHDFFDPSNVEGERKRNEMARIAFSEMVDALKEETIDIGACRRVSARRVPCVCVPRVHQWRGLPLSVLPLPLRPPCPLPPPPLLLSPSSSHF